MHLWLSEHKSYIVNIIPYLFAKRDLDEELGCSWHVVVGQQFGMDITFEVRGQLCFVITAWPIMIIVEKFKFKFENCLFQEGSMIYLVLGSMAILMWKCGSQLLSEADYKVL